MKEILMSVLLAGSAAMAEDPAGIYSDDNYVVCDVLESAYQDFVKNGFFETESLSKEGFIHCAKPHQLNYVMGKYFTADRYVLFVSHKDLLGESLVYEGRDPNNLYPHLRRAFYMKDLIKSFHIIRNDQGVFEVPLELQRP